MKDSVQSKSAPTNGVKSTEQHPAELKTKLEEDASFHVKIQGLGVEPFELRVHKAWLVQDVLLAVLAREEVAPRTSFSLSMSGTLLDPHSELDSIKSIKAGATLRLVEDFYTPRTARAHMAHLQELLRASGPEDALREGRSPSLLNALSPAPPAELLPGGHGGRGCRRSTSDSKQEQQSLGGPPPEYILPGTKERPLMPLLQSVTHTETQSCLLDLSLSCWNPPPGTRKLQGDFLYINVKTLEGQQCDITSCPKGFYQNRSTMDVFDPRPATTSPLCHCLTDLLSHISPGFKQGFAAIRHRSQQPLLETLATPYRTPSWLGPSSAVRSHRTSFTSRLGPEEHAGPQVPDWNEELQAARDLPQGSLEERLHRDRAILQVNSAFVWAAAQGAEAVIDGCIAPINGAEEDPAFLWGGLFLSPGGANRAALGGERGRRALQRQELMGAQAYTNQQGDLQALHTLPTAVVDYRGFRLSAQGLAPGLEGAENAPDSRGVLYGVTAGPQEGTNRRKLLELVAQAAKSLNLQRHAVIGPAGYQVPLFTSADTQGLLGADGRFYLLDLFRTQPADPNFLLSEQHDEQEGWTESYSASTGFPKAFPHTLCRLRPELVQAFIQHKSSQFSQRVKERMEESGGVEECVKEGDPRGTDAVRGACKDVGSVSNIIFEMRFNPDVFSPGVEFPSSESSSVNLQKRLLREAAAFIITVQLPAFIEDCLQLQVCPVDGRTLCQALHQRGINLRYLGQLVRNISQSEHREQLRHITRLVYGEMLVRSARRVFNTYLQNVDVSSLSASISHFLCCLLVPHFSPNPSVEEPKKRSRRRGRGGGVSSESMSWGALSGTELWKLLNQDAKETYDVMSTLGTSIEHLVEEYGLQKVSVLRELCLKTGIQLRLREFNLDKGSKAPISPDDILNMFPVAKHLEIRASDATRTFQAAQKSLQKGQVGQAHEQLKEAAYLFGRVCDDLQPEACACLSLLARIAYQQGKSTEARGTQIRAVVASERVLGFDHPNTMQEYALLAVYTFAGRELGLAQRCLYRARLLMLLLHGEDHPFMATLDSSLGLVLLGEQSIQYLQNALRLNNLFRSANDPEIALNHHLLAQRLCCIGDYRGGMAHEREAHAMFLTKYGEDHQQTKCSSDFLRAITQQAVRVERSLRQGVADLIEQTPPENLTPSFETTLEQLALVNGILKVTSSNKVMEFKQKLQEMRALAEAEVAMNGVKAEGSPFGETGKSGEDTLSGSEMTDAPTESSEGNTNGSEVDVIADESSVGLESVTISEECEIPSDVKISLCNGETTLLPPNDHEESIKTNGVCPTLTCEEAASSKSQ